MDQTNPYATPRETGSTDPASTSALGELVKGWEKLRLIYNGILLFPGIMVVAAAVKGGELQIPGAIAFALVSGFCANLAFCAGPLAELYFRALFTGGRENNLLRKVLLILGILISLGVMGFVFLGIYISIVQGDAPQ